MIMLEAMLGYALPVVILLAVVAALVSGLALRRLFRRLIGRLSSVEQAQAQLAEYFEGLTADGIRQGRRLAQIEQQLGRQHERLDQHEQQLGRLRERLDQLASSDGSGGAFNTAIRLARKGISAREIMETCGLSEMEADLVILLHRERGAPISAE
ncbi:MAG: DUF2802 domain-containing protein [Nitrococcus sp.]|nr:DUF2802 domain-containing protein [Nitrococcus sp.]